MAQNQPGKKQPQGQQITVSQQKLYQGPIPEPDELQKYEDIQPGFAERLLQMAEKEQQHRHQKENNLIVTSDLQHQRDNNTFRFGQICALIAVALVVGLCVYSFYLGNAEQAKTIAVSVIIGLAGVFALRKLVPGSKENK
jgi:uncharacterized membrane protein